MTSKMKSISRFTGMLGRAKSTATQPSSSTPPPPVDIANAPAGSPEANVVQSVRLFCESGAMSNGGEEVLHLPAIVDAAESSPVAAAAAAQQIRKFLTRDWSPKPHVQYNAIMLIRILSDNPGPSFTRNFDKAFVSTVKELLRNCKDGSTQQILRETLDNLEVNKSLQEGLEPIITMWRKEKGNQARLSQGPSNNYFQQQQGGYGYSQSRGAPHQHRSHSNHRSLPAPQELASRIEEARNTAKILLQLIQSTPAEEVINNDLLREFADRCQSAQRSMQGYINCNAPPPDDDTMLTLIETNEQLSLASSRYQRAQLSARKALGLSPSPSHSQTAGANMSGGNGPYQLPPVPPATSMQSDNLFASPQSPPQQQRYNNQSAFAPSPNNSESFTPPEGPPPSQQPPYQTQPQSAFAPTPNPAYENPPPGPPPAMLARLNSREGQTSPPRSPQTNYSPSSPQFSPSSPQRQAPPIPSNQPPQHQQYDAQDQQQSDPFADPVEHDPSSAPIAALNQPGNAYQNPAQRPHSQTFSINAEPSYAPLNAVPASPERPGMGAGAYHTSSITGSYLGRQADAAGGVTMSGAQPNAAVSEIDGYSEVGRTGTRGSEGLYDGSPVERR